MVIARPESARDVLLAGPVARRVNEPERDETRLLVEMLAVGVCGTGGGTAR